MSHSGITFSEPGTPLLDRTVGELVAERPGRSRVFQKHNIDFCCQGGTTLREACERKGVAPSTVVAELEDESAKIPEEEFNPALLPPERLSAYIVEKHHGYLRQELPRLHAMSERVARVHGGHTESLVEVYRVFTDMANELTSHMMKEEQVLFPAVEAISSGEASPASLEAPVAAMMQEHDEAGAALAKLRELTNGFQPPPDACNTYRALFDGLQDLETDLHRHIHLENSVLFPAARKMVVAG
ncbi:MAG: iron-sulfur cluster repair di-iron protein [Opitutales bacterium]